MKITDKMIMAAAGALVENIWLMEDWNKIQKPCKCCGIPKGGAYSQDDVDDVKRVIRETLEAALKAAK
jgi:hypothetical protein